MPQIQSRRRPNIIRHPQAEDPKNINRQMSEVDKVRKLIEGIPHELQQQFRLLGVTHLEFLTKLRVVSEHLPKAETITVGPHPSNYITGASSAPIVFRSFTKSA
jgi:hypothetical protein